VRHKLNLDGSLLNWLRATVIPCHANLSDAVTSTCDMCTAVIMKSAQKLKKADTKCAEVVLWLISPLLWK